MDVNAWHIRVGFPADWPDEPFLADQWIEFCYPTEIAARDAQQGFELRGAVVGPVCHGRA